jgi:hypothetical protein
MALSKRILSIIFYLLLIFLIPFLKYFISHPYEIIKSDFQIDISKEAIFKYF